MKIQQRVASTYYLTGISQTTDFVSIEWKAREQHKSKKNIVNIAVSILRA